MLPIDHRDCRSSSRYPPEAKKLVALLSQKHNRREIANALGLSLSTTYRWLLAHRSREFCGLGDDELPKLFAICRSRKMQVNEHLLRLARRDGSAPPNQSTNASKKIQRTIAGKTLSTDVSLRLEKVRKTIQQRYYERLTCDVFANIARMSKYNFINRFTRLYGTSPYRYLLCQRVMHAKRILGSTLNSANAVAIAVGFDSSSSLSKAFRSVEGITLGDFLRNGYLTRPQSQIEMLHAR